MKGLIVEEEFQALEEFLKHHPNIKWHPYWQPKYMVEDGVRRGPFMYSSKWTEVEFQKELLFPGNSDQEWREKLVKRAYNKSYIPPDNHILLAAAIFKELEEENRELKLKLIASNKELSKLKREKKG